MNIESCSRSLSGEKMRDAVRAALIRHRAWKWGLAAAATAVYCAMNNKRRPQNTSCFFSLHLNPHSLFFFSTIKWRHKINKYEAALSLERPFPSAHTFLLVLKTQNKIKKYLKKKGGTVLSSKQLSYRLERRRSDGCWGKSNFSVFLPCSRQW